ncbi:hypothetical protein RUND412_002348 [Rhizina undulata]
MLHLFGAAIFLLVIFRTLISLYRKTTREKNIPPGPPTLPFIGNLHQLPKRWAFLKFTEWANQYGGIFSLKFGPQTVMVVTDPKIIHELFEKRGAEYSSRPETYVVSELILPNKEVHVLWLPYSPIWRAYRNIFHMHMGVHVISKLEPFQKHEILHLMLNILATPSHFEPLVQQFFVTVPMATVWGKPGSKLGDPHVQMFFEAHYKFTAIIEVGAVPPVDQFPFLKWIPEWAAPWKRSTMETCDTSRLSSDCSERYHHLHPSIIMLSILRARNHDSTACPNPSEFMPERFLNDEKTALDLKGQRIYTFGAGRRMCAGENYAKTTLFLVFAMFAWTFNITASLNPETGESIVDTDLETAFHSSFALCPNAFKANFESRSKERKEIIEHELQMSQETSKN